MRFKSKIRSSIIFIADFFNRLFPGRLKDAPHQGLGCTQIYPAGINLNQSIFLATKKVFEIRSPSINEPIASVGTCFAEEISRYLLSNSMVGKYLLLEKNQFNFSANWGRVYTIKNFSQIVSYSLDSDFPVLIEEHEGLYFDPLRERGVGAYQTYEQAKNSINKHRELSRKVFTSAKWLVITLGQNEGWQDQELNIFFGGTPSLSLREKFIDRFSVKEFSYEENLIEIESSLEKIKKINPNINFILTVSPVACGASFLYESVVEAAWAGKAILRSIAHEVVRRQPNCVQYFPSFEMVVAYNPKSYMADNRHVKRSKVKQIFNLLGDVLQKKNIQNQTLKSEK